jgi:hypothetical protein
LRNYIEEATMSEITCPSGLRGIIRKMKVQEARTFANLHKAKGDPIGKLLRACWEETLDPGPYDFVDNKVDWNKVLLGDRLAISGILNAKRMKQTNALNVHGLHLNT